MFTQELAPVAGSLTVRRSLPYFRWSPSSSCWASFESRRTGRGWPRWWSPWSPDQDPPVRRNRGHPPGVCGRAHPRTMSRDRHRSG